MDKASDILKRVRRIELRARHLATENFAGQYQSGFRGQGLDFDDFRNTRRETIPASLTGR